MSMEWRPAPGFEGYYEVSDTGEIRRSARGPSTFIGRLRIPSLTRKGYLGITLCVLGRQSRVLVHKLVAGAFLGPRPPGNEVNHRDLDKTHNAASNLQYVTRPVNQQHAVDAGRTATGERHHRAKLTENAVQVIRSSQLPLIALAFQFGVSIATVSAVRRHQTWKHTAPVA